MKKNSVNPVDRKKFILETLADINKCVNECLETNMTIFPSEFIIKLFTDLTLAWHMDTELLTKIRREEYHQQQLFKHWLETQENCDNCKFKREIDYMESRAKEGREVPF